MPQPDLTPAQQQALQMVRREFPSARKRGYTVDRRTGHMRVRLQASAGEWVWWFDRNGRLVDRALRATLFDMPAAVKPPRSAIDN